MEISKYMKEPCRGLLNALYFYKEDGRLYYRFDLPHPNIKAGEMCGEIHGKRKIKGSLRMHVYNSLYAVSRMVWIFHNGTIPKLKEVSFLDGDIHNTRIENLVLRDRSLCCGNGKKRNTNTSGVVGVYWDKRREGWYAKLVKNKQEIFLGFYKDKDNAIEARREAEKKYGYNPKY